MADLKRWFKVWTSVLDDPHFQELDLADIGRWALLGAMLASVGSKGRLQSPPGARRLREVLRFDSVDALRTGLRTLPNVHVNEAENRHGDFIVTMIKWNKYQVDTTQAARAKTSRSKKRGEEKRGEEKREEENYPPVVPPRGDPAFQDFWTAYPKARQIGKGKAEAAWRKVRPSQALVADILAALERQKAGVRWREDGGRYVPLPATWLNQRRWEDTVTEGPLLSQKTQGNLANLQAFIEANRDPR